MLKLGDITLDTPFFQAPLSGYSDYPMRKMALSYGAPLTFAGVMLAKSAAHPKVLAKPAFIPRDDEHPVGAQILGSSSKIMARAAKELVRVGYDLIDLNFACPAPKVIRRKRGGFLLTQPERAMDIYNAVKDTVDCPVTIKLRAGFDHSDACRDDFWRIVELAAQANIDAVAIHPRTVKQRFAGSADWQILTECKKRFPQTTIIGSGDLLNAQAAADCINTTGIDGVLIARGAIGNPWIFNRLRALLNGKAAPVHPDLPAQAKAILTHFRMIDKSYEHKKAVRFFRKFIVGYCKRHPHRKKVQAALLAAKNKKELLEAIDYWYNQN